MATRSTSRTPERSSTTDSQTPAIPSDLREASVSEKEKCLGKLVRGICTAPQTGYRAMDALELVLDPRGASERAHPATIREGRTTVDSAWRILHDLKEGACPECQGSAYVPSPTSKERMVDECRACKGTGTSATKKAA
jgi:hypothetical protein